MELIKTKKEFEAELRALYEKRNTVTQEEADRGKKLQRLLQGYTIVIEHMEELRVLEHADN